MIGLFHSRKGKASVTIITLERRNPPKKHMINFYTQGEGNAATGEDSMCLVHVMLHTVCHRQKVFHSFSTHNCELSPGKVMINV